jgi:hypothetical protein
VSLTKSRKKAKKSYFRTSRPNFSYTLAIFDSNRPERPLR